MTNVTHPPIVFYKKVGRRYVACAQYEPDLYSGLSEGTYLVNVKPGCTSTMRLVKPSLPGTEAALFEAREVMLKSMLDLKGRTIALIDVIDTGLNVLKQYLEAK